MVNASLNWASIVGIVLAVGGALLYFMRSFKPALARDYDVFFAAIGLLCGGILFFQGWRLDPILQFGQFLLAGTTVFFAYESVRLRGVTTEQARRSSYFDDEEPAPYPPRNGLGGSRDWGDDVDRFDEPQPLRRRIRSRDGAEDDDLYRPRRPSRVAIPERAVSRRPPEDDWDGPRRDPRSRPEERSSSRDRDSGYSSPGSRYTAGGREQSPPEFGSRRRGSDKTAEPRRGSRPTPSSDTMPRSSRRQGSAPPARGGGKPESSPPSGIPRGTPIRSGESSPDAGVSDADYSPIPGRSSTRPNGSSRDNSSRFDD